MKRDYANLDLLRAVAVTLVFSAHLAMVLGHLDDPLSVTLGVRDLAQFGVLIFFIHTSLVLMMSLERLGTNRVVPRFYIRRAFRIYPLAWLAVGGVLAFRIPPHFEPVYTPPTAGAVWQNLLLVQNLFRTPDILGPMWSLPLEVQMYLVLPLIYIAARRIKSYFGALALVACGFACWYLDSHLARLLGRPPAVEYAPWFFMGATAYGVYRFVSPRLSSTLYSMCLVLFITTPSLVHGLLGQDYRSGWVIWGAGVLFALLLPHFQEIRCAMVRKLAYIIATYSYGIYLVHVPIMWYTFQHLSGPWWVRCGAFVMLMIVVPVFLYHSVEAPLIKVGGRLAAALEQGREVPLASVRWT